jgi:hypothetical protein
MRFKRFNRNSSVSWYPDPQSQPMHPKHVSHKMQTTTCISKLNSHAPIERSSQTDRHNVSKIWSRLCSTHALTKPQNESVVTGMIQPNCFSPSGGSSCNLIQVVVTSLTAWFMLCSTSELLPHAMHLILNLNPVPNQVI